MVGGGAGAGWQSDLERWLAPFLARLGHKARQRMCPPYVAGLIGPGDRKSIQPMAERLGLGTHDRLHHFVSAGNRNAAPLLEELARKADNLLGGDDAVPVVDDTALPKTGSASVGAAPQYASALGKRANCQTLVSLTLARGEVPVMVGLRPFLPDSRTAGPERRRRAGVPAEVQTPRAKPGIAIEEIDRLRAAGLRFGAVPADAGYGLSAPFRRALSVRDLRWAVGIPRRQKVCPADVAPIFPVAGRGRPRQRPIPGRKSPPAEAILAGATRRSIAWRRGTKGRLSARFAALRVRAAGGPTQRIGDRGNQHMPGEEAWLIGERRTNGGRKFHLSNLPAGTSPRALAATIEARWICEQAHQQLKEGWRATPANGLDHFEGRSWTGLHRHALMTMIAYAFLQAQRLTGAKRGKTRRRTAA
ncbi:MAG: IS701 family transposase [Acetobacteraceae bacterium]|nr:IS701 family transposase [Acetobacteraceae bacterium]